jgi:hypothetical protein
LACGWFEVEGGSHSNDMNPRNRQQVKNHGENQI